MNKQTNKNRGNASKGQINQLALYSNNKLTETKQQSNQKANKNKSTKSTKSTKLNNITRGILVSSSIMISLALYTNSTSINNYTITDTQKLEYTFMTTTVKDGELIPVIEYSGLLNGEYISYLYDNAGITDSETGLLFAKYNPTMTVHSYEKNSKFGFNNKTIILSSTDEFPEYTDKFQYMLLNFFSGFFNNSEIINKDEWNIIILKMFMLSSLLLMISSSITFLDNPIKEDKAVLKGNVQKTN